MQKDSKNWRINSLEKVGKRKWKNTFIWKKGKKSNKKIRNERKKSKIERK